ncbi:MAG TPA: transmembrane repetitive protein, partial [Pseudoxanthomonas sp.]|nr:transmembrane repetitive protein [Pseudoxanthomonas sp.]
MTKAADIIAALAAGKPPLVFERRSGMTYGWGLWMRSLPERLGTIRSDLAEAMVGLLAQRPRRPLPPRVAAMGGWRAFRSLFYPHWDPPMREERGLRWLSGGISLLMHLLFVLLLVLVAMMRVPPLPPDASDGTRVQVEFIGQGTPEEEGGGPPAAEAASAPVAAQVPSPAPQPAAATAAPQVSTLPRQEQ